MCFPITPVIQSYSQLNSVDILSICIFKKKKKEPREYLFSVKQTASKPFLQETPMAEEGSQSATLNGSFQVFILFVKSMEILHSSAANVYVGIKIK